MNLEKMLEHFQIIAKEAGQAIMKVYEDSPEASFKEDGSPVTMADEAAEAIILSGLKKYLPEMVIISEENSESHKQRAAERFILVDPLDGTKEFLKRDGKGAFTVNLALMEKNQPVAGVVYAPAIRRMFSGIVGHGASEISQETTKEIKIRVIPDNGAVAVASSSHRDEQTNQWLEDNNISETIATGSSLKFCLVACGEADVYPRFGPTMEWDTAAGDAVLRAAGGKVLNPDGTPFVYGKTNYRNGPFIAFGETN